MPRLFVLTGAFIFFVLGAYHGALTFRDLWTPRAFTPTNVNVRLAMQASRLALSPSINLWKAWLGFNFSHSLGLLVFGGGLVVMAWGHFPYLAGNRPLQVTAVAVAIAYFALSARFWFWIPTLAIGIGLTCFVSAFVMLCAVCGPGEIH